MFELSFKIAILAMSGLVLSGCALDKGLGSRRNSVLAMSTLAFIATALMLFS